MQDLDKYPHHPELEKLVDIICTRTQNDSKLFFRILVAYYFCKIASTMRVNIKSPDRGIVPINMYAINLAYSGHGKGYSMNILEDVLRKFKKTFLKKTMLQCANESIDRKATQNAVTNCTEVETEAAKLRKEFNALGPMLFSFDSATTAAVKQMRQKLLMAECGAMSLECDEIGSNLLGQVDVLTTFLELFDIGNIKQKLVKNTSDNLRSEELEGITPTNMMLFGTPMKLLNGSKTEEEFISLLETGFARRCFFGVSPKKGKPVKKDSKDLLKELSSEDDTKYLHTLSAYVEKLADISNFNRTIEVPEDVAITLLDYKHYNQDRAFALPEYREIQRTELQHRDSKVLKLAGAYAFFSGELFITPEILQYAIRLAEDSGIALQGILNREKPYERLAQYIASEKRELTHVDITEDLPFYKGSDAQKRSMIDMAVAYGYKHNIIIKKIYREGIEFFQGEALEETDINKLIVSYSKDITKNYKNDTCAFDQLHKLTQAEDIHWVTHHLTEDV